MMVRFSPVAQTAFFYDMVGNFCGCNLLRLGADNFVGLYFCCLHLVI